VTETVWLQEVGPRDGLQNESLCLSAEQRCNIIERLADAGLPGIQIGAFVNPRKVPQMAGTDRVWRLLRRAETVRYSVLVLNERGLETALTEGVPHVELYVSASEAHSMRNSGTTVEKALNAAVRMVEIAVRNGTGVTVGVMCAFGCSLEGLVPLGRVLDIVAALADRNALEIGLADTPGIAEPQDIRRVVHAVADLFGGNRVGLHLHDTRGFGMANLRAALEAGIRRFDVSVGGLGGCPFIPGAAGNISTETTAGLLASLGFETGIKVEKVAAVRHSLENIFDRSLS
jgi:hydroxymethylglutaryl-CoA lyase